MDQKLCNQLLVKNTVTEKSQPPANSFSSLAGTATRDSESVRILFASPILAHAKARSLVKAGWQVHITDADGGVFHPEKFDVLLRFDRKPSIRF